MTTIQLRLLASGRQNVSVCQSKLASRSVKRVTFHFFHTCKKIHIHVNNNDIFSLSFPDAIFSLFLILFFLSLPGTIFFSLLTLFFSFSRTLLQLLVCLGGGQGSDTEFFLSISSHPPSCAAFHQGTLTEDRKNELSDKRVSKQTYKDANTGSIIDSPNLTDANLILSYHRFDHLNFTNLNDTIEFWSESRTLAWTYTSVSVIQTPMLAPKSSERLKNSHEIFSIFSGDRNILCYTH